MDEKTCFAYEETIHEVMSEAPTIHPDEQTSKSESRAIKGQVGNIKPNTPASDNHIGMLCLLNP